MLRYVTNCESTMQQKAKKEVFEEDESSKLNKIEMNRKALNRYTRDFKIWYGEAVVRRQIVKITSGDVMSRVRLRLSRRSLAFYYGKVPSFTIFIFTT